MNEQYRIVIRDRESGETVEIVNDYDGQALTSESADAFAALRRALLPNTFGHDKGTLRIDVEEIEPEKPQSVAERWLAGDFVYPESGEQIAACLRGLADMVAEVGGLPAIFLTVGMQVSAAHGDSADVDRIAAVDEISAALGRTASHDEASYAMRETTGLFVRVYAPRIEPPTTEPEPTPAEEAEIPPSRPVLVEGTPRVDAEAGR